MSDIRFNQWLHQSGTGGVSQSDGGHVGIGTTNPLLPVGAGNTHILHVGVVTSNSISAGSSITATTFYGSGANLTSLPSQLTLSNNADNRVITGGSGVNLNGEANLTFDGSTLGIVGAATLGNGSGLNWGDTSARIRGESGASGLLRFDTNGGERLRITSGGNIGINQTNPNKAKLHLVGPSSGADEILAKFKGGSGSSCKVRIGLVAGYSDTANDAEGHAFIGALRNGSGNQAHLTFETYNGSAVAERVRITSTGILKIERGSASDTALEINTTSTSNACRIKFNESGSNKAQIAYSHDNDQIELIGASGQSIAFYTNGTNKRAEFTTNGHFVPNGNNTFDLGSTANGWRNVYMNDLNLSNMKGNTNDIDGTQGSWTIQEGKDDLYIINRLNGKKFKIKMEEIT